MSCEPFGRGSGFDVSTFRRFDVSSLDFELPEELIAQRPAARREDARLLVADRGSGALADRGIADLPDLLGPDDLLVLNDTKVLPARFHGRRATGGLVEGLFIEEQEAGLWRVMLKGSRRLREGETIVTASPVGPRASAAAPDAVSMLLLSLIGDGHWLVGVGAAGIPEEVLARVGETPLPPYIRRAGGGEARDAEDRDRYQTVYARTPGAVAAPTAGLHLTENLLAQIRARGARVAFVTLHVGIGTFKPITAERIADHVMHAERYVLPPETAEAVAECRTRGGRVVAVGTTSVRVLETAAGGADGCVAAGSGSTNIFIHPPYRFRVVDALLTNFHLPRSTLLALVMAFAGEDLVRRAYRHAIERRYRFFSYGDAMLLL